MSDVYCLEDDAQRYVAEVLATHGPQDLDALVDNYVPPKPNDMADIKAGLRDGSAAVSNVDAKSWLIEEAIAEVNRVNDNYEVGDEWIEEVISLDNYDPANHKYGQYRLADGVDADKLVDRHGEPLIPKSPLPDLYDPETGAWRTNSRTVDLAKRAKLRESMEKLGWQPHLPGIKDEFGVTIVGHAREALAEELGIEPVFKVVTFGVGPAATAAKVALDIASNTGGENISPADRKKIAKDLYGDGTTFSMDEIGKMLKVATSTVSRDLRGFADAKPPAEHGGRPRKGDKESQPKPQPEPNPEPTVVKVDFRDPQPEPQPEPEPEPESEPEPKPIPTTSQPVDLDQPEPQSEVPTNVGLLLDSVTTTLSRIAEYVESLDADGRVGVYTEHELDLTRSADIWNTIVRELNPPTEPTPAPQPTPQPKPTPAQARSQLDAAIADLAEQIRVELWRVAAAAWRSHHDNPATPPSHDEDKLTVAMAYVWQQGIDAGDAQPVTDCPAGEQFPVPDAPWPGLGLDDDSQCWGVLWSRLDDEIEGLVGNARRLERERVRYDVYAKVAKLTNERIGELFDADGDWRPDDAKVELRGITGIVAHQPTFFVELVCKVDRNAAPDFCDWPLP